MGGISSEALTPEPSQEASGDAPGNAPVPQIMTS